MCSISAAGTELTLYNKAITTSGSTPNAMTVANSPVARTYSAATTMSCYSITCRKCLDAKLCRCDFKRSIYNVFAWNIVTAWSPLQAPLISISRVRRARSHDNGGCLWVVPILSTRCKLFWYSVPGDVATVTAPEVDAYASISAESNHGQGSLPSLYLACKLVLAAVTYFSDPMFHELLSSQLSGSRFGSGR